MVRVDSIPATGDGGARPHPPPTRRQRGPLSGGSTAGLGLNLGIVSAFVSVFAFALALVLALAPARSRDTVAWAAGQERRVHKNCSPRWKKTMPPAIV